MGDNILMMFQARVGMQKISKMRATNYCNAKIFQVWNAGNLQNDENERCTWNLECSEMQAMHLAADIQVFL